MKLVGLLLALIAPLSVHAGQYDLEMDAKLGYPLSAGVSIWGGYNELIWGDAKQGYMYGYVRPHARLFTAGVGHRVELRADIYPISFFGFTLGEVVVIRHTNQGSFNCDAVVCKGVSYRSFVENNLKLAYGNVFGTFTNRGDYISPAANDKPFADWPSSLLGDQGGDILYTANANLGLLRIFQDWSVGAFGTFKMMIDTKQKADEFGLFAKYFLNDAWSFTGQISAPYTPLDGRSWSIGIRADWVILPGLGPTL
jgi:hypothetical protein